MELPRVFGPNVSQLLVIREREGYRSVISLSINHLPVDQNAEMIRSSVYGHCR